ncbi:MAG: hypothetical protein MUP80_08655 [Acidobacteriia bacterium]|nr:hypothetical protein [Terriglobia bacterium]
MDNKVIQQISERMRDRSTEELRTILSDNDSTQWSEEAFEAVKRVLSEREHHTVCLQHLEDAHDIDGLLLIIADQTSAYSDHDRKEAAKVLMNIKDTKATAGLLKIAKSSELPFETRTIAFSILGKTADHQTVTELVEMSKDKSEFLRDSAMETLQQMDGIQDIKAEKAIEEYRRLKRLTTRTKRALFAECNYLSFVLGVVLVGGLLFPTLIGTWVYFASATPGSAVDFLKEALPFLLGQLASSILFAASLHRNGKTAWGRFILWALAIVIIPKLYSAKTGNEMYVLGGMGSVGLFILSGYVGVLTKKLIVRT